eukprot:SAG11_NODE_33462_length_277_cov_0.584270_1_plen_53_part_00
MTKVLRQAVLRCSVSIGPSASKTVNVAPSGDSDAQVERKEEGSQRYKRLREV